MESLKISVDLKRRTNEVLSLQQGYTYPVELSIFDNGIAYTCTGATAQVHFLKSTGKFSIKTTDITISGNKVSFKLDNTLINRGGVGKLQIVLTKDGDVFGSWAIHCNVFANVIQDESTEDSNIIDVLGDLTKNIAKADPLAKTLEKQIPQATPLTNSLKTQIPQAAELVNEMKSAIEEGGTVDKRELGEFKKGYTGKEYGNLEQRINGDIDHVQQQINDSSLLPYEGTSIKADNTYYGLTKEAIVKGRTLQNLLTPNLFSDRNLWSTLGVNLTFENGYLVGEGRSVFQNFYISDKGVILKPSTTYTIILDIKENTLSSNTENTVVGYFCEAASDSAIKQTSRTYIHVGNTGTFKIVVQTKDTFDGASVLLKSFITNNTSSGRIKLRFSIFEGDHTNTPIEELPYGEGIYSVGENEITEDERYLISGKSCGKNLFIGVNKDTFYCDTSNYTLDGKGVIRDVTNEWNKQMSLKIVNIKPNTTYRYSCSLYDGVLMPFMYLIRYYDNYGNPVYSHNIETYESVGTFETPNAGFAYAKLHFKNRFTNTKEGFYNLQIEESTSSTPYEPYQESTYSYILDRPLMQLPNGVADSINLETGVLTRRVGEIVLNENMNFVLDKAENHWRFVCPVANSLGGTTTRHPILSNQFYFASHHNEGTGFIYNSYLYLYKFLDDVSLFKAWLKSNPTTVYYELAEPTTEQLTPTQLKSFEGTTHIMSNNTVQARTSVKIPSNVQMVVQNLRAENKALNVELKDTKEELINTDLDILEMNWETDFRVCELEYAIYGQAAKTTELENNIRVISKYEQAKTLILADRYNKATMTKQLEVYFDRGYISEKEYQELIELMN